MAITSETIRVDAQLLCGYQINSITCFTWVKDIVKYIARKYEKAATKGELTASVAEGSAPVEFVFPHELVMVDKVRMSDERRPVIPQYYEIDEAGKIKFFVSGNYVVEYRYVPDAPATVSTEIPLPERFAEPIKYYIAARQRYRVYGNTDSDAQNFDSLFFSYIEDANSTMSKIGRKGKRIPVRY